MTVSIDHGYIEDCSPGQGRLHPRAAFATSAPSVELDGVWRFRLAPDLHLTSPGFEAPDFDDAGWAELAVAVDVADARLRHTRLHQRPLPVPGRPAPGTGR